MFLGSLMLLLMYLKRRPLVVLWTRFELRIFQGVLLVLYFGINFIPISFFWGQFFYINEVQILFKKKRKTVEASDYAIIYIYIYIYIYI
jgi:hypothetical protein